MLGWIACRWLRSVVPMHSLSNTKLLTCIVVDNFGRFVQCFAHDWLHSLHKRLTVNIVDEGDGFGVGEK